MTKANYTAAADLLAGWRDNLLTGRPPTLYRVAASGGLSRLEIGPGLVGLIGGPPGVGKTALTVQLVMDAIRIDANLRAVVVNVEMPAAALLDRQLARFTGIDVSTIRHRRFTEAHRDRLDAGLATLAAVASRLAFVRPPFDLRNVASAVQSFDARLLLVDYVQRLAAPKADATDRRGTVGATMSYLRQFADEGLAVIAVAAVGRSKDAKGRNSYSHLSLASFRETSELEYGADDAFLLVPDPHGDPEAGDMLLRHEKSRYGERADVSLRFNGRHQRFHDRSSPARGRDTAGQGEHSDDVRAAVAKLWGPSTNGDK